ncbi:MAG: exonuclease SbcCD subunit D C-terminal domain-containing protein [Saprospirales bacterium]|nr:exonuclease SbcCD subunit D C-terminal domain-containing protein [Saprospirales bacterium]
MRILHTSDWHLGQKFLSFDREEEHRLALDWLLQTIVDQRVDGLIVAGDIFDIGNPPNSARKLYYQFLASLLRTNCKNVLIIAGNHDSAAMLEAPREILKALRVDVVGAAGDEVLEWKNDEEETQAIIAAVPFLRERDLRYSVIGESGEERLLRLREAIKTHYQSLAGEISELISVNPALSQIPIIATGHLFAIGAYSSDKQDNIYLGDTENIGAGDFPDLFSYVALGHIHRAQAIGGKEHIRYSGSLVPLSFSETKDEKGVYILEYEGAGLQSLNFLACPTFRRLKTIEGDLDTVKKRLLELHEHYIHSLPAWVEVLVALEAPDPGLDEELHEFTRDLNMNILKIRIHLPDQNLVDTASGQIALEDLSPEEVFLRRCRTYGYPEDQTDGLLATFRELLDTMNETA